MNCKKSFFLQIAKVALFMALGLLMSCKDEDEEDIFTVTINAGQPSDDGYEITEGETWNSSDQIVVINNTQTRKNQVLTYNGSAFTGYTTGLKAGNTLSFFYPADAITAEKSDTLTQSIDIAQQDGSPETVLRYKVGSTTATVTGTTCTETVTLKSIFAVVDMKFQVNGAPIPNIKKIEFRAKEGDLYASKTFSFYSKAFTSGSNSNLTIENGNGLQGTARLAMIPTDDVLLEASVFTTDGRIFVGTSNEETALVAGSHYDWTFDCEEGNAVAHVGDYFYSDLTVSSDYDKNKSLIGIVFALTDSEDGPINNALKESHHGRIVALKDAYSSGLIWAAYQNNIKMPDFTTVDGSQEEGFLPYFDGKSPTSYKGENHIQATITEDGRIDKWPSSGLVSDFNGKENTAYADSSSSYYPAGYYAVQYTTSGVTAKRFYLPSGGEMALLYELTQTGIITAATKQKFVDLEKRGYWLAAEREENKAWFIQFSTGGVYANYKQSTYYIRSMMHF